MEINNSASVRPQALAWRGHEPPEALGGSGGLESGGGQRSAAGGPAARRMRFARRFGRVAPPDPRASRRLCRTLGLPESPPKRPLFVRRRSRGPVCPDPAARCRRVPPRRKNLSLAGVEIRSRVAYPVPARVGRCRAKWENRKVAEREGFEPSVPVLPVRRFSKPLLSATQPSLRTKGGHKVGDGGEKVNWEFIHGRISATCKQCNFSVPWHDG